MSGHDVKHSGLPCLACGQSNADAFMICAFCGEDLWGGLGMEEDSADLANQVMGGSRWDPPLQEARVDGSHARVGLPETEPFLTIVEARQGDVSSHSSVIPTGTDETAGLPPGLTAGGHSGRGDGADASAIAGDAGRLWRRGYGHVLSAILICWGTLTLFGLPLSAFPLALLENLWNSLILGFPLGVVMSWLRAGLFRGALMGSVFSLVVGVSPLSGFFAGALLGIHIDMDD